MENVHFASASATSEFKFWSIFKDSVIETAMVADSSLFWLTLTFGSLQYNVCNLDAFSIDKSLPLRLIEEPKSLDAENMDDGKVDDDDVVHYKRQRTDGNAEDTTDAFEELWSDDDDDDDDEDDSDDQQGTDSYGEDDDDDDDEDDDDGREEDCSDEDEDEFDEEEEEGSTSYSDDVSSLDEDMDDNPLLRHARMVYADDSFCAFEHEYRICKVLSCNAIDEIDGENGLGFRYKIGMPLHYAVHYNVTAIMFDNIVNCSCNYFSIVGILCSHALFALRCLRIERIPDRYLLKWRMKSSSSSSCCCCSVQEVSVLRGRQDHQSSDDCLRVSLDTSSVDASSSEDDCGTDFDYIVAPILRHAKSVYISKMYHIFREEYKKSKYLVTHFAHESLCEGEIVVDCIVNKPGHVKTFEVHAEAINGNINCSCRKFDLYGLLCSHALAVLECVCMVRIPSHYLHPVYTKGTNICSHENIHGPRFAEFEKFTHYKVMYDHLTALQKMAFKDGKLNFSADLEGKTDDLSAQLIGSLEDSESEESTSSDAIANANANAAQKNMVKEEAKFYDDQLVKNFTYKESESRRKPLFPYFPLFT